MGFQVGSSGGSAAAHCGEALPHRHATLETMCVEAEPRRRKSKWRVSVSRRLTALGGGKAAKTKASGTSRKLAICATSLLTAHRTLLTFLLLAAFCLLPSTLTPSLTVGLLPRAFSQNQPQPIAQPSPAPSP